MSVGLRPRHDSAPQTAGELASYVRECVTSGAARSALLLRLALLPPEFARPHHRRLARAALAPLAAADRARLFEIGNGDLVVIWRGEVTGVARRVSAEIAHLFADTGGAIDADLLVALLTLPTQADLLLDAIAAGKVPRAEAPSEPRLPLDPATLTRLEDRLVGADVARFARRKGVYERLADDQFALRWEKRFLSVAELAQAMVPEHNVQDDAWLFRRLTRSLDRRMLALLASADELREAGPFSLNLNVTSVLSPEFLRFDAALPASLRGRVIIDMLPADVMADPGAYMFARDFARARGYRLLLRGVGADLLGVFTRERLGVDLMQIRWSPALAELDGAAFAADRGHCVLTRASGRAAMAWGRANGVLYYQRALEPSAPRLG